MEKSRRLWGKRCIGSLALGLIMTCPTAFGADSVVVKAEPILSFLNVPVGMRVGQLVWQGGFTLTGDLKSFGGLSGIAFIDASRFVAVGDRGTFVSGELLHSSTGFPLTFADVQMSPILDEEGLKAERGTQVDAEAIDVVFEDGVPAAVRVGFERITRVSEFRLENGRPVGAARHVQIPNWLSEIDNNDSIESLCLGSPNSPVAHDTLIITENFERENGHRAAALLNPDGHVSLDLRKQSGVRPSDCAFLPDGDLLVLLRDERGEHPGMQIKRIAAAEVREGVVMDGPILIQAGPSDVGNMEGLAVRVTENGEVRLVVVSDNGFDENTPTMVLEFSLIGMAL